MKRIFLKIASAVLITSVVLFWASIIGCICLNVAHAAPTFYTSRMIERRGLTDAQYETLWSIGKSPRPDTATLRDWYVRAAQNDNFTAWLDSARGTNEWARLCAALSTNNVTLAREATAWRSERASVYAGWTNALVAASAATNRLGKVMAYLEKKRDEAKLSTTKAIYTAILGAMEGDTEE